MTTTPGRNDPCPCGSGRKYKRCCGVTTTGAGDSAYDRIRRLDAEASDLLMRFARKRFGSAVLESAWHEFWFSDGPAFDTGHAEFESFLRWFEYCWKPPGEGDTLAGLFLKERGQMAGADVRRFMEATLAAPYSFFQTLDTEPGTGLVLRDVLRKREVTVSDRTASSLLEPGQILLGRVVTMDNVSFLMGNGAYPLPSRVLGAIMDLRGLLAKAGGEPGEGVSTEFLLEQEEECREWYFDLAEETQHPRLDIRNTDGDPLSWHTLTYEIPSFEEAFHALKDLEQKPAGSSDAEMLANAERDEAGAPVSLCIHWLKRSRKGIGQGLTGLGTVTIKPSSLVVEVNSKKRAGRIQKEIARRLGDRAVLMRTEIRSTESLLREGAARNAEKPPETESEHERLLRESPELKAHMKQMMDRHWEEWCDEPIPALRGMTPRQAAKDEAGRELLESLLLEFEQGNRKKADPTLRIDTRHLRHELGMDTPGAPRSNAAGRRGPGER